MILRYAMLGLFAFITIVLLYVAAENTHPLPLTVFGSPQQLAPAWLIFAAAISGALTACFARSAATAPQRRSEERQIQWQAQDAKLMAEVQTDREKQLQAKIDTLEAALKQALKKK